MKSVWENAAKNVGEPMLLRPSEVARMLGIGRSKVYEMIRNGELPVVRIGTTLRIPRIGPHGLDRTAHKRRGVGGKTHQWVNVDAPRARFVGGQTVGGKGESYLATAMAVA